MAAGTVRDLSFVEGVAVAAPTIFDSLLAVNVRASEGAGTTTLVNADAHGQVFQLTANRTVAMPTTGVAAGDVWRIKTNTAFKLTITASGGGTIIDEVRSGRVDLIALQSSPTLAAHWLIDGVQVQGAWTPSIQATGVDYTLVTYVTQVGTYARIGRVVYYQAQVVWSLALGGTSSIRIIGLPFTSIATANAHHQGACEVSLIDFGVGYTYAVGRVGQSSTFIDMIQLGDNAALGTLPSAVATAGSFNKIISVSGSYIAA